MYSYDFNVLSALSLPPKNVFHPVFLLWREEKQHPELIRKALHAGTSLDLAPFESHLGNLSELNDIVPPAEIAPDHSSDATDVLANKGGGDDETRNITSSNEDVFAI